MIPESDLEAIANAARAAFPEPVSRTTGVGGVRSSSFQGAGGEELLAALNTALAKAPRDLDLLLAKASALRRMMQFDSAAKALEEVLVLAPAQLDATMRSKHDDLWPLAFDLPAWSAGADSTSELFDTEVGSLQPRECKMYLARDGVAVTAVAIQSMEGYQFDATIPPETPGLVQVLLHETSYGPIVSWYVLLDDRSDRPFLTEAFLFFALAHPETGLIHPFTAIPFLQRLIERGGCWLVFVDGIEVRYNRWVSLLPDQLETLRAAVPDLIAEPPIMNADQNRRAADWVTKNVDFSEIRFPGQARIPREAALAAPLVPAAPGVLVLPPLAIPAPAPATTASVLRTESSRNSRSLPRPLSRLARCALLGMAADVAFGSHWPGHQYGAATGLVAGLFYGLSLGIRRPQGVLSRRRAVFLGAILGTVPAAALTLALPLPPDFALLGPILGMIFGYGVSQSRRERAPVSAPLPPIPDTPRTPAPAAIELPLLPPSPPPRVPAVGLSGRELVEQLVRLGSTGRSPSGFGFLSLNRGECCRVGEAAYELGGHECMVQVCESAGAILGGSALREIEVAWGGIGEWES